MDVITIPKTEYLDLINLYHKITEKIQNIKQFETTKRVPKRLNAHKYCGVISITDDALNIQKQMRDEWE